MEKRLFEKLELLFRYKGYYGPSWVIFGERKDKTLLGVVTIESMRLEIDPIRKRLKPTELLLL